MEIVLALGVQASALCPCLFQLAIECVDGLCPLLQYQFELGGVACFVFDLAAQANDGGWELVDMPLQLLDGGGGPPVVIPFHGRRLHWL